MKEYKCIWSCGTMRHFIAPFVWRNEEEKLEIVFNASGLICDRCGAVAIEPGEGNRIQKIVQELLQSRGLQEQDNSRN